MKKDRNSFFSEYNMNAYNSGPMMPNMYPNQVASQSSFYSGPAYDPNMMNMYNTNANMNTGVNNNTYTTDIESRISKLERQINRLETRLTKLENEISTFHTATDLNENTYNTNMYMV